MKINHMKWTETDVQATWCDIHNNWGRVTFELSRRKTSISGWRQKAQLVWIWTEHELSRILTSWWHHQWANFFGRFEGYFSTSSSSSSSSCWSSSSPWSDFRDHWPIWRSLRSSLYYKLNLVGVVYIILFHHNYHIRIVAIIIIMITNYDNDI